MSETPKARWHWVRAAQDSRGEKKLQIAVIEILPSVNGFRGRALVFCDVAVETTAKDDRLVPNGLACGCLGMDSNGEDSVRHDDRRGKTYSKSLPEAGSDSPCAEK